MSRRRKSSRRWWHWPLLIALTGLLVIAGLALGNGLRMLATEDQDYDRAGPGRGRWVQAHDVKLHITEHGAADAPLLVLVGGVFLPCQEFGPAMVARKSYILGGP